MTDLQSEVTGAAQELDVPGVAVGIDLHGHREVVTVGVTSVDHGRPVDATTLFQIGSTAKTFTATAMMILADQGLVALDGPVRDHLPELRLPDSDATLTVTHLLNHTAGWDGGDSWTDTGEGDDALARSVALLAELPQRFRAGTGASYDNAAFVIAGHLIERVTGQTFERALKKLILEPLGLDDTTTSLNDIMTRSFALGHRAQGSADGSLAVCRPWSDPRGYLPAGARFTSSLGDQLTWARFQLGDGTAADGTRLLTERSLQAMHQPSTEHELMPGVGVGIGWLLRKIDGVRLVEHHGDVAGQHSSVTVVPERDGAVVVLTNATPNGRELAERIVGTVLADRFDLVEPPPETLHLSTAELAAYTGTYRTEGLELRIVESGGGLMIHGTMSDDEDPGETVDFPVGLVDADRYLIVDGPFAGMQGEFVREAGTVVAARHVGRLVPRSGVAQG